jgi:microcystin-dependent protein
MTIGIRGINPIWTEFDLTGHLFDDSFYLYVLQNTIPYIPTPVYHDVDLSIPWTNPIQFLANGTLPIDIFWDPTLVYRLEFRQNNGIVPPSQNDPLIYEVDNYVPGTGGSTPVTTVAFPSGNQIVNAQFALFNLSSPITISVAGTYNIAPGWFLDLAGSGLATITQVPLNSANPNPSNAPYALHLVLSGWNADSVVLRQRFHQNGLLWSNKAVAATVTAATGTEFQSLTANLVSDLGTPLADVLNIPVINTTFTEYTGIGSLPASTDTTFPPTAYVELQVHLSSNNDIYLTSFQLIVEDPAMPFQPAFTQDTIDMQINTTYSDSYPIIPVGTVIDFAGFVLPQHYLLCDGTAYNRIQYNQLFRALTTVETVLLTNTMNTFTVVSSANYRIGMAIEGNGIPASTTISNISGTTITISNAATATVSSAITFFASGDGDGSTTFNVPDLRDFVTAGLGGSLFSSTHGNGVGGSGGAATHMVALLEIPQHTHNPGTPGTQFWENSSTVNLAQSGAGLNGEGVNTTGGITTYTAQTALSLVQQTALMKKCIRYQ